MAVNGRALTAVAIGSTLVWSGIRGWSVLGTASDIILGKAPEQVSQYPLTVPGGGSSVGSSVAPGDGSIAGIATQYQGHAYRFGGAPGRNGDQPWDCSSFCNYVIGVKLGLAIPGYASGGYDGTTHGPPTGMWGVWPGLTHISRQEVQAGDLVVWLNHMGIAVSNSQMISALNPETGTKVTSIDGYGNGPILCYGRYGKVVHNVKFN